MSLDRQQLALDLEPYLIGPPWSDDLCKRFPEWIQRDVAQHAAPIRLGHHPDYGFFALEAGILWMEVDPDRKIITPEVAVPEPAPDPRGRYVGWVKFCPCCGADLRLVTPDDKDWGDFCGVYRVAHGTEWFLCSGVRSELETDCVYKNIPLVLHNPVRGWRQPPGDNWALGYVK